MIPAIIEILNKLLTVVFPPKKQVIRKNSINFIREVVKRQTRREQRRKSKKNES